MIYQLLVGVVYFKVTTQFFFFLILHLAGPNEDYKAPKPTAFIFDQNNVAYNVTVPIINDSINELPETFQGKLDSGASSDILILNESVTTFEILDDDCKS